MTLRHVVDGDHEIWCTLELCLDGEFHIDATVKVTILVEQLDVEVVCIRMVGYLVYHSDNALVIITC